jgi:sugar lactone lactonase YvrE
MGKQSITPSLRRVCAPLRIALVLALGLDPLAAQTSATALPLMLPSAIAYDAQGNLYIAETGSNTIRRVDAAGVITTIAGTGVQGFSGDGGPAAAARLDSPEGLALGADDSLYVADTHNHRIRRIDLATGLIVTVAGSGAGFAGDGGMAAAARLNLPTALAVDVGGNLYIADTENFRIRKIASGSGLMTTIAGNGVQGFSGDGGAATAASIDSPAGLAVDAAGNLYIADTHNHRIRRVDVATGVMTTIAGTGAAAFNGDDIAASAAALALPRGLGIDGGGNLYIADTANHRIRRIDAVTHAITTIAGSGVQGFSGDGGPAATAGLDSPGDAVLSPAGLPTLADTANGRVRQLDAEAAAVIQTIAGVSSVASGMLTLAASPAMVYGTGELTASFVSASPATGSVRFTLLGDSVATATTVDGVPLMDGTAVFDAGALPAGSYTLLASYSGDSTHTAAQSQPLAFQIPPRPLVVTPDAVTILYGQPVPALTGSFSGLLPRDEGAVTASFTVQIPELLPAGVYPIAVAIAGAAAKNYALTAVPASLTVRPAPTVTTLATSSTSFAAGSPVALTAHTVSTTGGIPSGTVTLMDGAASLMTAAVLSNGDADFSVSALAPGQHSLTAVYAGNGNFGSSVSASTPITVIPGPGTTPGFTLSAAGTATQTIPAGGVANFDFTVQIQGSALASPITLAASGLPPLATASFNPAYLPPGTTPASFTMTITMPQTTALDRGLRGPDVLLGLLLFPVIGWGSRSRRLRRRRSGAVVILLALALCSFCSGCGSRVNTGDSSGDLVKTYPITVTATATGASGVALTQSMTVELVVHAIGGAK